MPKEINKTSRCQVCGKYCGERVRFLTLPLKCYDCSNKMIGIKPTKISLCEKCAQEYIDLTSNFSHLIYTFKGVENDKN